MCGAVLCTDSVRTLSLTLPISRGAALVVHCYHDVGSDDKKNVMINNGYAYGETPGPPMVCYELNMSIVCHPTYNVFTSIVENPAQMCTDV